MRSLRIVLFAGEVFPLPQFALLRKSWARPRYFNLYGPTETNVCTYYEVPGDDSWTTNEHVSDRAHLPAESRQGGRRSGRDRARRARRGNCSSLGPNVMQGYWNLPDQNARAFVVTTRSAGAGIARATSFARDPTGEYVYLSRRDRMVKRRGYRIELGEIETGLMRHPDIREAAVVAVPDTESGVRIAAFVSCRSARAPRHHRAEVDCVEVSAAVHDSRRVLGARRAAEDIDRQDRLSVTEDKNVTDARSTTSCPQFPVGWGRGAASVPFQFRSVTPRSRSWAAKVR